MRFLLHFYIWRADQKNTKYTTNTTNYYFVYKSAREREFVI